MKHSLVFLTALAVAMCFGITPAFAQHGGGHGGGPPVGVGGGPGAAGSTRGNTPMGGSTVGSESVFHSSPTTLLSSNPKLASTLQTRLGPLLPAGTSLTDAASGFKNLGQFIAALHVSHNLGIPFQDLKAKTTAGNSLGKAIQELKPDTSSKDAKSEAKRAENEAREDIKESGAAG
jgi:hypothetical protein